REEAPRPVSAAFDTDLDLATPPARRPGTGVRFLLFLLAAVGSAAVLMIGFPRGAPDRLAALAVGLAIALTAVVRPGRGVRDFCLLFPVVGVLPRILGAADPFAWPLLVFGALATGWTFRFLYDFKTSADPSRLDGPLRALAAVWALGTLLAIVRATTWWSIVHGVTGRAVNGDGLRDAAAVRESALVFAVLAAGAGFFFLLRRSGAAVRTGALRAALIGTAISALLTLFQVFGAGLLEKRPFWRLTGRLSGGASDPNALGLLCGLAIPVVLSYLVDRARPRWAIWTLVPLPVGLALSGSRSGFLIAVIGSAIVIARAPLAGRWRIAAAAAVLALALAVALVPRNAPGGVGGRLGHLFRSTLSLDDRVSSRPILWRAALAQFGESPLEGGGLGSFAWRLPDLAGADRVRLGIRDNPGSAYLQALAETGVIGLGLTLLFVVALAGDALAGLRDRAHLGPAAALLVFLLVLVVGSHWLAPEVSLLFFLLCATVARAGREPGRLGARIRVALVVLYGVAVLRAALATADSGETFRHGKLAGFYGREKSVGGEFRWTRRRFAVHARSDGPERISLANYSPEGRPVEVTVRADEGPVLFRRTIPPGGSTALALWPGGRPRVFFFELSRAFVPKRFGLPDRRELGVVAVFPEDGSP
ncbi:MAG TPA: O-antigen ligase family protein, partial [Thermoanaerobaculia bacterium]|nr:O-antigen ligase family protein [Thermoanaerobaculia bacterium]